MILNNVELNNARVSKITTLDINIVKESRTTYLTIDVGHEGIHIKTPITENKGFNINVDPIYDRFRRNESVAKYLIENEYASLIYKNHVFYHMQLSYKLLFQYYNIDISEINIRNSCLGITISNKFIKISDVIDKTNKTRINISNILHESVANYLLENKYISLIYKTNTYYIVKLEYNLLFQML